MRLVDVNTDRNAQGRLANDQTKALVQAVEDGLLGVCGRGTM